LAFALAEPKAGEVPKLDVRPEPPVLKP